ncbi:MAG: hypothetical protein LBI02_10095 [Opitutaceae bacterium]|jgi:hypothetical protein|nr:hypothetical protein [Opitutaceae bacterium]
MRKFAGKRHAIIAHNRLKMEGRRADMRRHLVDTVAAERAYEKVCRETTKHTIKRTKAADITARLEARKGTTRMLGECLEETGLKVFFADTIEASIASGRPYRPPVSIHMPGDTPGAELVYKTTNCRRVNFFPEHSAQKHAQLERQLTDYINGQVHRGEHVAMMTFNGGSRWREGAETAKLREGRRSMRAAMTLLFRSTLFRRWFDPINIGEEYGTPKGRYSRTTGRWRWHVHTHAHTLHRRRGWCPDLNRLMTWVRLRYHQCLTGEKFPGLRKLMDFDTPLAPAFQTEVAGWLKETQAGVLVEYDGEIKHVEEACKYPFKDKDLNTLRNEGGAWPIRDLYDNLFRARLCTPLNGFRRWRKSELFERNGFKRKIIARKAADSGCAFSHVNDWNCQTPNMAEAVEKRKKRARELAFIRKKQAESRARLKAVLAARIGEWHRFQDTGDFIKPFPRKDFRLDEIGVPFDYPFLPAETALKREITELFARLISSAVIFDLAIPAFVLEAFRRFPEHVQTENAVIYDITAPEVLERKQLTNFVTARTAPSFLGGGTIARPGIVVIGATDDGRVWRTNPLAMRLERLARPLIAEAVAQRDMEAAMPDMAPPADDAADTEEGACAWDYKGCSQTPLNFPFYTTEWAAAPPGNADWGEIAAPVEA